jgi:hypothetical protein
MFSASLNSWNASIRLILAIILILLWPFSAAVQNFI